MGFADARETEFDSRVYVVCGRRDAKTPTLRIWLAIGVLALCVWTQSQNSALNQRVDAETAAWASQAP